MSRTEASGLRPDASVLLIITEGATDEQARQDIVGYPPPAPIRRPS
jgi:hypothetical protein